MASLDEALALAQQGFHVFPVQQDSKLPAIDGWQDRATTDQNTIRKWWLDPVLGFDQGWNIGICTTRFNCEDALLVVDVDNKGAKNGSDEIIKLELEGYEFPVTRKHTTPTGGEHLVYRVREPLSNGVNVLAQGLDIRSRGGFVVAPGSAIGESRYSGDNAEIAPAPEWLVERLGRRSEPARTTVPTAADIDQERATKRGIEYLKSAPIAVEGEGGDHTTFQVACKLKDFGLVENEAVGLLVEFWNDRCCPPWSTEELETKVANAYRYGKNSPGVDAPESQFPPLQTDREPEDFQGSPVQRINQNYAFIEHGAFILHETTDSHNRFTTHHLSVQQMHNIFANKRVLVGKKEIPISQQWMEWPGRRQYKGIVFSPERDRGPDWYNLWRGFRIRPADTPDHPSVAMFKEHALKNVCGGDAHLYDWLMSWFAHLVQRPYEKPLVACVFKGEKGTGKNALVERVGWLLGPHFMVADDDRYVLGNFNSHLEHNLFMVLDEAAWAGDKRAEGRLKGLITGSEHNIERKGQEAYKVDNLTRIAIIGNEEWLVPASAKGERRYAVFNVGSGRMGDREFFQEMREGMEAGGYANLLRYLMDYHIRADLNQAPETQGLIDQKVESLDAFEQWWFGSLREESLLGSDIDGWPETIHKKRFKDSLYRWLDGRGIRNWKPNEYAIGRHLKKLTRLVTPSKRMEDGVSHPIYRLGTVEDLRLEWEAHIGGKVDWE